jgi:hypothetical protein
MRQGLLPLSMLLLAMAPRAGFAQPGPDRDSLVVWGAIERLYSSHRLLVRADDDRLYTVRAAGTPVELSGGDLGRWDDLRRGLHVDVYGTARDDQTVDASYIRLTGGSPRDRSYRDEAHDRYRDDASRDEPTRARRIPVPDNSVEILGAVTSVDRDRESIRLDTRRGLRRVELFDDTILRTDSGDRLSLADVQTGDELAVLGQDRGDRLVADRVTLLGPSRRAYSEGSRGSLRPGAGTHVITGTVRGSTYYLSRRITVRTPDGDVKVDVDRDTPIEELGDRISVHELEPGDHIRVYGDWSGTDRFAARRIEVTPTRAVRTLTRSYRATTSSESLPVVTVLGQLVSFDENRDRMRLSTRQGDRIVVANGLPAYVHGAKVSRRNFQAGDRVRAWGYWNGQEILATRVELAY